MDAPTGYGTHMREMIAAFRRAGHEVRPLIAGNNKRAEYGEPTSESRIKVLLKKYFPSILWETLKDISLLRFDSRLESVLEKEITEFEPDLIYERSAYLQNSGVKLATKMKLPHIVEINAPYPEERVSFSGRSLLVDFAKNTERELLVKSTMVSVVSSALKEHFVSMVPEAADKLVIVPNSVNPDDAQNSFPKPEVHKERINLQDELVIGFVGSIFPYHGVDTLIEAFANLPRKSELKLLVVGDGEMLPELKALAKSLDVLQDIIFSGSVPHREVYSLIELMDICCMARSNWYGSPVKIFEYGLMKKPVIAPDVAPVRDVMTAQDGILVGPTVDDMTQALLKLIEDKDLRDSIAESWHTKVLKNYTWDHSAKLILEKCTLP
jgi:glycosyltransferase involved in cell wall biosynthesis